VEVTSTSGLGSLAGGATAFAGAALDLRAAIGNEAVALSGSGTAGEGALLNGGAGAASLAGPVTLDSDVAIGVTGSAATLTLSGTVAGGFEITKVGSGTLILSNSGNSFSGGDDNINLNAGTLSVSSDGALGNQFNNLNFNGGSLATTANITTGRFATFNAAMNAITVSASTTLVFEGLIDGPGALVVNGPGDLELEGGQGSRQYLPGCGHAHRRWSLQPRRQFPDLLRRRPRNHEWRFRYPRRGAKWRIQYRDRRSRGG
jgi:autotransporter-associated beta strand protein